MQTVMATSKLIIRDMSCRLALKCLETDREVVVFGEHTRVQCVQEEGGCAASSDITHLH